ncbi:hypothetical protein CO614_00705 [Lysobacteraceae bacterium NML120232]|nr:hypothetical protein CO614_00705 [Xanthomonadaceae bacterium NML120232]
MTSKIFREEYVKEKARSNLGRVKIFMPLSTWVISYSAILFVILIALISIFGKYTRTVKVRGAIVPSLGLTAISAESGGQVQKILVSEGDYINAGEPLVSFSRNLFLSESGNQQSAVLEELNSKKYILISQLELNKDGYNKQRTSVIEAINSSTLQIDVIKKQRVVVNDELENKIIRMEEIRPLIEKSYISKIEADQYASSIASAKVQLLQLEQQEIALAAKVGDYKTRLSELDSSFNAAENDINIRISDINQQIINVEATQSWVLHAPVSGVVSALLVDTSQSVKVGDHILSIFSKDDKLKGYAIIPNSSSGLISQGQKVIIRYNAYPHQKFGNYFGVINKITRSTISDRHIVNSDLEGSSGDPFKAEIEIDQVPISDGEIYYNLKPGMTFDAEIIVDRRNIVDWLLDPVRGIKNKIFPLVGAWEGKNE